MIIITVNSYSLSLNNNNIVNIFQIIPERTKRLFLFKNDIGIVFFHLQTDNWQGPVEDGRKRASCPGDGRRFRYR